MSKQLIKMRKQISHIESILGSTKTILRMADVKKSQHQREMENKGESSRKSSRRR